jgi:ribonuclease R
MVNERKILQLVNGRRYRPTDAEGLADALGVPGAEQGELQAKLDELEVRGEVVRLQEGYVSPRKENLWVGRLTCHPSGFGFVETGAEGRSDVYIAGDDMGSAMHGDLVAARVKQRKRRRGRVGRGRYQRRRGPEGRVIRVIERANERLVGTYRRAGSKGGRLEPEDGRIFQTIYLETAEGVEPKPGEKVVCEVTRWPGPGRDGEGRVVKVLGAEGSPEVDLYQIAVEFKLPQEFPSGVLEAAERVPEALPDEEVSKRRDLRDRLTITIDPERAKDFDDALSLFVDDATGHTVVLVSIADVSYFVRHESLLDAEALKRGLSVYLGADVIPMLPKRLSGDLCSLIEGQDRLAKTVRLEFNEKGKLARTAIMHSVVRVDRRMSFNEVNHLLESSDAAEDSPAAAAALAEDPGVLEMILKLEALAGKLRKARQKAGSIDLDMPEFEVLTDDEGRVTGVSRSMRDRAHTVVEEFMLQANRTVAAFMKENNVPCIYRVHQPPRDEDMELFGEFVEHVTGRRMDVRDRRELQKLLDDLDGTALAYPVNLQLLRSMTRAHYEVKPSLHYALHFKLYCHFTSPVRRYPDLAVHQLLDAYFAGKLASAKHQGAWRTALAHAASQATEAEYRATEAEREHLKISLMRFLSDRVGEVFDAVITGAIEIGFFVELVEYALEGLVKAQTIGDDYYRLDKRKHALVGARTGRAFQLGDKVRVQLQNVDLKLRQVDFLLVESRGESGG